MVFAAIDVGSNAVRLLVSNVHEEGSRTYFNKLSLTRAPIRLGEDVFLHGRISERKADKLVKAMLAFRYLMEINEPQDYLSVATSAMRHAANGDEVAREIRQRTGIGIEIISGQEEAELIYSTHVAEQLVDSRSYLYIEVGGGSTEVSLFARGRNICSHSFPIGTLRILHDLVGQEEWESLRDYLQQHTADYRPVVGIGTGGNINSVLKLLRKKEGKAFSAKQLKDVARYLRSLPLEYRVRELGLRPDRADVIVPATEIYLAVMKWAGIETLIVPKLGLADGIIHRLYERHREAGSVQHLI